MNYKYSIEENDLGVDYQDEGAWRSYGMEASGDSLQELIMNATIYETGQDGDELGSYSMFDAGNEIEKAAFKVIENYITKKFIVWEK